MLPGLANLKLTNDIGVLHNVIRVPYHIHSDDIKVLFCSMFKDIANAYESRKYIDTSGETTTFKILDDCSDDIFISVNSIDFLLCESFCIPETRVKVELHATFNANQMRDLVEERKEAGQLIGDSSKAWIAKCQVVVNGVAGDEYTMGLDPWNLQQCLLALATGKSADHYVDTLFTSLNTEENQFAQVVNGQISKLVERWKTQGSKRQRRD